MKNLNSYFLSFYFFCNSLMLQYTNHLAMGQNSTLSESIPFHVGVVLDIETQLGKISNSSIYMALSDFYAAHTNYATKLVLYTRDSKMGVSMAASAALELVQEVEVQAIIGPQLSEQADFIVDLGDKAQVPIISFSATSPSLSSQTPYFVQATPDDHVQVQAVASIVQAFSWRKVILIHEDTEYGNRLVPHLILAFQEINIQVTHRSNIPPSATDDEILQELENLMTMHTSVFIVHISHYLGSRFFPKVKEAGIMSEGYAWIITYGLMNVLESIDSSVINSMQGVLGVDPYIPESKELANFVKRWRIKFLADNPNVESANMNVFGLWAYDTIYALAMAAERVTNMNPHLPKTKFDRNWIGPASIEASETIGSKLLEEIRKINIHGLSGKFHLGNGQLNPSAFQILNVIGKERRVVGFWTPKYGISRDLKSDINEEKYSSSKTNFGAIFWPGDSLTAPKGLLLPKSGKKLKIGVPVKEDFNEFVKVEWDARTNSRIFSGYCIDTFISAVASLPYPIPYEFIPFQTEDNKSAGTYTDLIYQVYLQNYDAVVGDTTITASRSLYVDFTQPYTDGGVWMIVPIKRDQSKNIWFSFEPQSLYHWIPSGIFFILIGFFIRILEQPIGNDFSGQTTQQSGSIYSILPDLEYRKKLTGILSSLLVISWLFIAFILTSNYIKTLTSILTVQKLQPTVTDFKQLIKNGDYVGYRESSHVVGELLRRSNFKESKLRTYRTPEECNKALMKGSLNGGVAAIFDEIPYVNIFLSKYCSKYTIVGPTHSTAGFGFAFRRGSPLVHEISHAVLNVKMGKKVTEIEQAWFGHQTSCQDYPSISLGSNSSWNLFLITATVIILSLFFFWPSRIAPRHLLWRTQSPTRTS